MRSKLMLAAVVACAFGAFGFRAAWADDEGKTRTTRDVVDFETRSVVFGESTLTRTDDGIKMHLKATDLPAGAYTPWIPIFGPDGPVVAGRVAGHVIGKGGNLTISVHLKEGEII